MSYKAVFGLQYKYIKYLSHSHLEHFTLCGHTPKKQADFKQKQNVALSVKGKKLNQVLEYNLDVYCSVLTSSQAVLEAGVNEPDKTSKICERSVILLWAGGY